MKIYRYRPVTPLLFKELLYQEIYLATYSELNDPLDLAPLVDFRATNLSEARQLVRFLLKRILVSALAADRRRGHGEVGWDTDKLRALVDTVNDEEQLDVFSNAILEEMNRQYDRGAVITDERLFHTLEVIQRHSKLRFLAELEALRVGINATLETFLNNSRVACFASRVDDYQLWSHYAGGHKGICLEFDLPGQSSSELDLPIEMWKYPTADSYEDPQPVTAEGYRFHLSVRKVSYQESHAPVRFYDFLPVFASEGDVDIHRLTKSRWHPFAARLRETFLRKTEQWSYEDEWRIVEVNFTGGEAPENSIFRYSLSTLMGLIFGCRIDDAVRRRIYEIVHPKSDAIAFYQARIGDHGGVVVTESSKAELVNLD